MEDRIFDRDTLLDLVVNAIPLGIMLFFVVLFVVVNPFGSDPVATAMQLTIVLVTFGALAILTYVSGKAISESEKELEEMEGVVVSESVGAETDDARTVDEETAATEEAAAPDTDAAEDADDEATADADEEAAESTPAE